LEVTILTLTLPPMLASMVKRLDAYYIFILLPSELLFVTLRGLFGRLWPF
jgi:hypothetical protein